MVQSKYKYYRQHDFMDCGPTCLQMIAAYYGKEYTQEFLREKSHKTRNGVNLNDISYCAEKIGFKTVPVRLTYEQLSNEVPLPCILHWNQGHFVVLYDIKPQSWLSKLFRYGEKERIIIADPSHGIIEINKELLLKAWTKNGEAGVALLLEPTSEFYDISEERKSNSGFMFLLPYVKPYKKYFFQILLGMLFGSIINMIFPFLTQCIVDYGVQMQNTNFIHLILLSQLLLFIGGLMVDIIRNKIILYVSTRLSISIIYSFLNKLMKLPMMFFDSKHIGDIFQRINDHHRIEEFLTGSTISTIFSLVNFIVFSIILTFYNFQLTVVFLGGSFIAIIWTLFFMKERTNLDYKRFQSMSVNQASMYELVTGMQEIKLNNCEKQRLREWEKGQAKLFKVNIKSLNLEQMQEVGFSFFSQLKNIIISFLSVNLVIQHQISIGAMLSISYIIGQMNGPLTQMIDFIKKIQDANISLERLGEIHNKPNEELDKKISNRIQDTHLKRSEGFKELNLIKLNSLDVVDKAGIVLKNVSFRYGRPDTPLILKDINLTIPEGKVTAIVGASGSGKTTLLKLLLKFYPICNGEISFNGENLDNILASDWRKMCGTVMQDGFIFSDTITKNIALDGNYVDNNLLQKSIEIANIGDYIKRLPLGCETIIGNAGTGMSGGQRQRLFIARAVYKNPKIIMFDEATSALDSNNESIIMENLEKFYKGKTVVVIAHRLSTVKNADQIVVLDAGKIVEIGTHESLISMRGYYYNLVKNQLELAA